ncbi:YggT family protein [Brackiella oedipodis]|uniref:YggT family protein n=1 Tax=Brackiella oedipodis TaxID=124225 RepID=UPI0004909440|nr:YggT family protein [Brackiella oedipodis]
MSILFFLISIVCTLLSVACLLCAWMYYLRIPPFSPLAMGIYRYTNWLIVPLRKILPTHNRLDSASLVGAWLICLLQVILMLSLSHVYVGDNIWLIPITGLILLLRNLLDLIFWLCLIYALTSWLNPSSPAMTMFRTLLEPFLAPIRTLPLIRDAQRFDFSSLILMVICQFLSQFLLNLNPLPLYY